MKWMSLILLNAVVMMAMAADDGSSIYLQGKDASGNRIDAVINDLQSGAALSCANCHRESGLGTSESGITIPPVSWRFLGRNQPLDDQSRFYHIQNKRPAYTPALIHRMLTTGINSNGQLADPLMPRYNVTRQQTEQLVEYLKTLFASDDPGVDGEFIQIATVIDERLPELEKQQHRAFLQGLFDMKNAGTRGELNRKNHASIQKVPQYESYRKWDLITWELPADTGLWQQTLNRYYQDQPPFVIIAPLVKDNYASIKAFCGQQKVPCLFPHRADGSNGDYYNYLYRDLAKQQRDYLASKRRSASNKLLYLKPNGEVDQVNEKQVEIPLISAASVNALTADFADLCVTDNTLLISAAPALASRLYQLDCAAGQQLKIMLMAGAETSFEDISEILGRHSNPNICWVSNYDKVLKRNTREIRVSVMARKFGIREAMSENLAKDLFVFGLLTDSMHQLAGNFSRQYLLEVIEHMLNSYPNYTYFSSVSGAPYQRTIVGPVKEYCPGQGLS
jgi:hypothetical protein